MAKAKKDSEIDVENMASVEDEETEVETQILGALETDDSEARFKIVVARLNPQTAEEERINSYLPEDIEGLLDRISAEHGPGKYKIKIYRNGRIYRAFTRVLLGNKKEKPMQNNGQEFASVIASAMENQTRMLSGFIQQVVNRPVVQQQPQSDPVAMMTALMTTMMQMKTFLAPPENSSIGPQALIEVFNKGLDAAQKLGNIASDNGPGETGLMDILKELIKSPLLEKLGEAATQSLAPPLAAPAQAPQAQTVPLKVPPPVQPAPVAASSQPTLQNPDAAFNFLIGKVRELTMAAAQNGDIEYWANWTCDTIDNAILNEILRQPQSLFMLEQIVPEVGNHRAWFNELLDTVREFLTDDQSQANSAVNGSRGGTHVPAGNPTTNLDGNS